MVQLSDKNIGVNKSASQLRARRIGVETQHEHVVFMREDCHVCKSEGFSVPARVLLTRGIKTQTARLMHVKNGLLENGEIGLAEITWQALDAREGEHIGVSHPQPLASFHQVRGKVYGKRLDAASASAIIEDIVAKRYSDVELAAFITACSARTLNHDEIVALTHAMVQSGDQLSWGRQPIVDKHCVGGLPGNRTTPIVVAIVAAAGLIIPKTSSRAITSPAGTADTMETLAPVSLSVEQMQRVVEAEGGCIAWGGAVRLSPADDTLIRVERALDLDSEGQLIASVLSKKIAAGSTHVVIDIPVGPTAKVRSTQKAEHLAKSLTAVANTFGLKTSIIISDGLQPVGRGIGPALEARDVLSVLQNKTDAPQDLRSRSILLAGAILELGELAHVGAGIRRAEEVLENGNAWTKFQRICAAQGGMREPPTAPHTFTVEAEHAAQVLEIDNRKLAKAAKLAGAPDAKAAGITMHVRLGDVLTSGQPVFTLHTESLGEMDYAREYVNSNTDIIQFAVVT